MGLMTARPHRQPLRYYGSKWRIADWIIRHFPRHDHYVEPYGGGANVLLRKAPSKLETYNDLDGSVVTFFKVLRERSDELIRAIELTPYARAELNLANDTFTAETMPVLDELEIARRFYVRCQQGRASGSSVWRTSWRYVLTDNRSRTMVTEWNETRQLWATVDRLKLTQLENRLALDVIQKYDTADTLFYLDPPYLHGDRYQSWLKAYQFEMSDEDHQELAECLYQLKGMVIISGYPSALYEALYEARGWKRSVTQARTNTNKHRTEAIWLNPAAQQRQRQLWLPL